MPSYPQRSVQSPFLRCFHVSVAEQLSLWLKYQLLFLRMLCKPPFQLRRPAAEVPAAGDNPVPHVEEVSWFLLPYRSCFLPAT